MNKTLNFLSYNNYYNRIIKRETSLAAYQRYSLYKLDDTNFNPNDGVHATHICNADFSEQTPDYLVVSLGNTIVSRWFVLEATRQLEGQYNVILLRDVVADYYDKILDVPMAIQRCMVPDSSPYIYNDEGMSFNQIKMNSSLLKDETESLWYVGYITNDLKQFENTTIEITSNTYIGDPDNVFGSWEDFPFYGSLRVPNEKESYVPKTILPKLNELGVFMTNIAIGPLPMYQGFKNGDIVSVDKPEALSSKTNYSTVLCATPEVPMIANIRADLADNIYTKQTAVFNGLKEQLNLSDDNSILEWQNKTIQVAGNLYRLTIISSKGKYLNYFRSKSDVVYNNMMSAITGSYSYQQELVRIADPSYGDEQPFYYDIDYSKVYIVATALSAPAGDYNIYLPSTRNKLADAPYTMFAIPATASVPIFYGSSYIANYLPAARLTINSLVNQLQVAQGGTGFIYDIQLLPYAPLRNFRTSDGAFSVDGLTENVDYVWIRDKRNSIKSAMFFPKSSSFEFTITGSKIINSSITNKKIQHATEFHRLVSPNGAGMFEFSAAANNGISAIEVNCTYKPFQPYIYLAPRFGGLYGSTRFVYEQRGLICSGDFSIPIISDAWRQYELSNKNYDTVFNRSIQNLETNRDIAREKEKIMLKYGTLAGTVAGAGAVGGLGQGIGSAFGPIGGVVGMGVGGIAGAVAGGVLTHRAGLADIAFNERTYQEQVDYQTDVFHLQMGNIQALPDSLTRIGAQTINNPVWPMLEFYSATDEEKAELQEYINYRSMRAGFVGTIREYKQSSPKFFQGSPMRITGINEDTHILIQISNELMKGVYI